MGRLQIIDETTLCAGRRWRRLRAVALLAGGMLIGYWIAQPDTTAATALPIAFAAMPVADEVTEPQSWCEREQTGGLRLSCGLQAQP